MADPSRSPDRRPGRQITWVPQEALDRMQADLIAHGEITRAQLSEKILQDATPLASYRMVELATSPDVDDAVALKAAQYILDREHGKPRTSVHLNTTPDNPVLRVLEGVVVPRGASPATAQTTYTERRGYPAPAPQEYLVDQEPGASGPHSPVTPHSAPGSPNPFAPPIPEADDGRA